MARTDTLENFLTDVADAIREKEESTNTIAASSFDIKIKNLQNSSGDMSDYFVLDNVMPASNYDAKDYYLSNIITKLPPVDTSNRANISFLFYGFRKLKEIPYLDLSMTTNISSLCYNCTSLTEILHLDTSNVQNFSNAFYGCSEVISIHLDTSNGTNLSGMLRNCSKLENITGTISLTKATNITYMLDYCKSLKSFPTIDLSLCPGITSLADTTSGMEKMEIYPFINTQNITDMTGLLAYWYNLKEFPTLDTSNVTKMDRIFSQLGGAWQDIDIPLLDCGKVTSISMPFLNTTKIKSIGGFKDLGKAYDPSKNANYSPYTLEIYPLTNLTRESYLNIFNNLFDLTSINVQPQKVYLRKADITNEVITQEDLNIAINKGWTITQYS